MQNKLLSLGEGNWDHRTIRLPPDVNLNGKQLWELVDGSSICALRVLGIDVGFIQSKPETWKDSESYNRFSERVKSLAVTNDAAERAIALMTDVNNSPRSRDENELQKSIQIIEDHRQRFPNHNKSFFENIE